MRPNGADALVDEELGPAREGSHCDEEDDERPEQDLADKPERASLAALVPSHRGQSRYRDRPVPIAVDSARASLEGGSHTKSRRAGDYRRITKVAVIKRSEPSPRSATWRLRASCLSPRRP